MAAKEEGKRVRARVTIDFGTPEFVKEVEGFKGDDESWKLLSFSQKVIVLLRERMKQDP